MIRYRFLLPFLLVILFFPSCETVKTVTKSVIKKTDAKTLFKNLAVKAAKQIVEKIKSEKEELTLVDRQKRHFALAEKPEDKILRISKALAKGVKLLKENNYQVSQKGLDKFLREELKLEVDSHKILVMKVTLETLIDVIKEYLEDYKEDDKKVFIQYFIEMVSLELAKHTK